jgi:hypothetical protein
MEGEAMARDNTRLIVFKNLKQKEQDDIDTKYTEKQYPIPPWKFIDKKKKSINTSNLIGITELRKVWMTTDFIQQRKI